MCEKVSVSKRTVKLSSKPTIVAQFIAFVGIALWIGGILFIMKSPAAPDYQHTITFNDHGTMHYLHQLASILPWVAFPMFTGAIAFNLWRTLKFCKRAKISMNDLFRKHSVFKDIEIEIEE